MSKNLISLKEASEIFKYHPDHLGFLIREKLIFGEKIGRNWFTTKESVRKYQEQKVTMPVKIFSRIIKIFVFSFLAIILLLVIFFIVNVDFLQGRHNQNQNIINQVNNNRPVTVQPSGLSF